MSRSDKEKWFRQHHIPVTRKLWKGKLGGGLWDADHIIRVADGGGMCGLENIRTLCIPCHKSVTAAGATEAARKRREKMMQADQTSKLKH